MEDNIKDVDQLIYESLKVAVYTLDCDKDCDEYVVRICFDKRKSRLRVESANVVYISGGMTLLSIDKTGENVDDLHVLQMTLNSSILRAEKNVKVYYNFFSPKSERIGGASIDVKNLLEAGAFSGDIFEGNRVASSSCENSRLLPPTAFKQLRRAPL